jgi:hypothetical protein
MNSFKIPELTIGKEIFEQDYINKNLLILYDTDGTII